jgi:hypothetical protein
MPKVKQISAWVEDRPGVLGQVADALGEKKVNIRAFMTSSMGGRGFVRVVVDRPAAARKVFARHGWKITEDDLVEVAIPDRPGSLAKVAERLGAVGIDIAYGYLGTSPGGRKVSLFLSVNDAKAALRALR